VQAAADLQAGSRNVPSAGRYPPGTQAGTLRAPEAAQRQAGRCTPLPVKQAGGEPPAPETRAGRMHGPPPSRHPPGGGSRVCARNERKSSEQQERGKRERVQAYAAGNGKSRQERKTMRKRIE